jgi:hypothetical protein
MTLGANMPMDFRDERGLRWTVWSGGAVERDGPSHSTLIFTSESGERRTSEAWLPQGASWDGVEERTWCALLRYSDVTDGQYESASTSESQSVIDERVSGTIVGSS